MSGGVAVIKERVRASAIARARGARRAIIDRMRDAARVGTRTAGSPGGAGVAGDATEAARGILLRSLRDELEGGMDISVGTPQGTLRPRRGAPGTTPAPRRIQLEDLFSPEEEREIMLSVEEALQSELELEEERVIAQYEDAVAHEEGEAVDDLAAWQEEDSDSKVICPVCSQSYLLVSPQGNVIVCSCGVRLDCAADGIGLEQLQHLLCCVVDEHEATACEKRIKFDIVNDFGDNMLRAQCECGLHRIVL
mmetsp:Transcript_34175/g.107734  ORF Transcript_34175/g.107734 Transcript_34175/m.107734 type:complete len:251 (+) Transcript_34175:352-1104(+)